MKQVFFLTVTTAGISQPEHIFSQISSTKSNYKFKGERRKKKTEITPLSLATKHPATMEQTEKSGKGC
jgi:hypothetical protein